MIQPDLFATPPRARARDPETSHIAARMAVPLAIEHRSAILAVLAHGPATIHEIAERINPRIDHVAVARRMSELKADGLVDRTGERRMSPNGRPCMEWRAVR